MNNPLKLLKTQRLKIQYAQLRSNFLVLQSLINASDAINTNT